MHALKELPSLSPFFFFFSSSFQSGGDDEPMSDTDVLSRDGDSPDALARVPPSDVDPETLEKLRRQVTRSMKKTEIGRSSTLDSICV